MMESYKLVDENNQYSRLKYFMCSSTQGWVTFYGTIALNTRLY